MSRKLAKREICRKKNNELKSRPCMDCTGTFPPVCMQWDHRPDEKKLEAVNGFVQRGDLEGMLSEIPKCDLVCANCHAIRSHSRGMTDEHKKKISEAMKSVAKEIANRPEVIAKKSAALKGKKRSPEVCAKISEGMKRRVALVGIEPDTE